MKKPLILALALVLSSLAFGYETWHVGYANYLASQGIIRDQSSNEAKYRLDDTISRQEVVGIALKISGKTPPTDYTCQGYYSDATFQQTDRDAWVCASAEMAADDGLISRSKSTFRPKDAITRAEALAILMKAGGVLITKNVSISQTDQPISLLYQPATPQWQRDIIESAHANFIIQVYDSSLSPDKVFGPDTLATRGDVFEYAYAIVLQKLGQVTTAGKVTTRNEYSTYTSSNKDFRVTYPEALEIVQENVMGEGFDIVVRAQAESEEDFLTFEINRAQCDDCYDNYETFYAAFLEQLEGMGYTIRPASDGVVEFSQTIEFEGQSFEAKGYIGVVVTSTGESYSIMAGTNSEIFAESRAELLKILGSFETLK